MRPGSDGQEKLDENERLPSRRWCIPDGIVEGKQNILRTVAIRISDGRHARVVGQAGDKPAAVKARLDVCK
jgi:hypothetical protein